MKKLVDGVLLDMDAEETAEFQELVDNSEAILASEMSLAVRHTRDNRLKDEVDPIVSNPLRWADMTTEQQNAWSQYRTDLLNITDQEGFPHDITWPTKP